MGWFSRKNIWKFSPAAFAESMEELRNPGRGWYRIYSMDAAREAPLAEWQWYGGEEETLALLVVDLGAYARSVIGEEALSHIRQAFGFFRERGQELLLRFVYDREGKALMREPAGISRIMGHMEQLAPLLSECASDIFCAQGLFVGNWGEMHGSKFLTQTSLAGLWQQFYRLAPKNCFFAVRKPEQWQMVTGISDGAPAEETLRSLRLGIFDDGLLGSRTDLGTFPEGEREAACGFLAQLGAFVPNGGEAVGEDPCGEIENAAAYFRKIRISYLNRVYDERVLSRWKNSICQGENGFDYIGRRLGYRFLVTDAGLCTDGRKTLLSVTIENRGFAPIYEECRAVLSQKKDGETKHLGIAAEDLRRLLPGETLRLNFGLSDAVVGELRLTIQRKKDGRFIRLANQGAQDRFRIGGLENGS